MPNEYDKYEALHDRIEYKNEKILKRIITTDYPTIYNWENLVGTIKGRLYIKSYIGRGDNNHIYYQCICECGNMPIKSGSELHNKRCNSCGCLRIESNIKNGKKKKLKNGPPRSESRIYRIWQDMHQRTLNPNATEYFNYGNKNIKICEEWLHDFKKFEKWALENGYDDMLTLERIDYTKGYSPDNCEWVTMAEQQLNKSSNKLIPYGKYVYPLKIWSYIQNLIPQTLQSRIRYNYPIYDILFRIPIKHTSYENSEYNKFNIEIAEKYQKYNRYSKWIILHPEYRNYNEDDYKYIRLSELDMTVDR